jgi:hypothetical protein
VVKRKDGRRKVMEEYRELQNAGHMLCVMILPIIKARKIKKAFMKKYLMGLIDEMYKVFEGEL